MNRTTTIRTLTLAGFAAGALAVFAHSGVQSAHAISIGVGELQECTISKSMDNTVDGNDFLTWQRNLGSTTAVLDGDGDVDGRDFLVWQRGSGDAGGSGDLADWQSNYGTGQAASAETNVPAISEIIPTKNTDAAAGDLLLERWQSSGVAADGDVDGRDFLVWQRGSNAADFDGDGDVDGRDFLVWQRNTSLDGGSINQLQAGDIQPSATGLGDTGVHEVGHWMGLY